MDFEQWKPLTGRGDPLRNDPTYDYEPPVLERVHYWADDSRVDHDHHPERKSEVLMLGVSSRKPSVAPRQPVPPRRHHRPAPPKYEDYSYKLSDHYPMTILVPPPPPPPGHKPSLYLLTDEKYASTNPQTKMTERPKPARDTTSVPEHLTSLYALQEANLIYQSSTTSQSWIHDLNQTKTLPNNAVSSDYAGWGPTTPLDDSDIANDTYNLISHDHKEFSNHPYSFYKPMLSEAPPPPKNTPNPLMLPTFVPTALPPAPSSQQNTMSITQATWPTERTTTTETFTDGQDYNEETTTEKFINSFHAIQSSSYSRPIPEKTIFDMLNPMMTMPLVNGPERLEDNLYAHASENQQVYKEHPIEDSKKLETMQTMQPPPVTQTESTTTSHKQPFHVNSHMNNNILYKKPSLHTHDPYLHMRFTTPMPTIASSVDSAENTRFTTEGPTAPMYLIIQGHSKVKTYGSKPKVPDDSDTINNEISKPNETNEVKHLHPIKDKYSQKIEKKEAIRRSRAQNLKSLIDEGHGSIEIQETDVGIKYDVSDGSKVPVEIYRKGIVDNDENDYSSSKKNLKKDIRRKRQIGLEDLIPFDEDTLEEYVFDFLKGRSNETGITGLIAQAVTGNAADAVIGDLDEGDDYDGEDR